MSTSDLPPDLAELERESLVVLEAARRELDAHGINHAPRLMGALVAAIGQLARSCGDPEGMIILTTAHRALGWMIAASRLAGGRMPPPIADAPKGTVH